MRRLLVVGAVLACNPEPCPFITPNSPLPALGTYARNEGDLYNLELGADGGFVLSKNGGADTLCIKGRLSSDDGGMTLSWTESGQTRSATAVADFDAGLIIQGDGRDRFGAQPSCDGADYFGGVLCVPGTPDPCTFDKAASNCH
jgi:hypothetical protein